MATLVRNHNAVPVTLPYPYNGVLPAGEAVVLPGAPADVIPNLGFPAHVGRVFDVREVADSELLISPVSGSAGVGVPSTRTITAGAGLTGGGDLSANRTINVVAADGSIVVGADNVAVGILQSDASHGTRGGGTQHPAATTSVAGFMSAADKTRNAGALSTVARLVQVSAPATASATAVHAAFAGNDASNNFPGPFTNPGVPRNATVTFDAAWDGGDVNVTGTDQFDAAQSELFTSNPGATSVGTKVFKTITAATKSAVGMAADAASIGTGTKLGAGVNIVSAFGILTVDGAAEAVTVDATNDAFTPTTAPNGARVYVFLGNV